MLAIPPPQEEFAKLLKENDAGVWERWNKASGGKQLYGVGTKQLTAIVLPIFKTEKITPHQAKALSLLFRINLSNGAHATLGGDRRCLRERFLFQGLEKGPDYGQRVGTIKRCPRNGKRRQDQFRQSRNRVGIRT